MDALATLAEAVLSSRTIPGLALAVVRNGEPAYVRSYGIRHAASREPVTEATVFQAASLSKPIVTYATRQLVDRGMLSLDERLSKHVRNLLPGDPAGDEITIRHLLTHTTGLPNWSRPEYPFKTYFRPGERFSRPGLRRA